MAVAALAVASSASTISTVALRRIKLDRPPIVSPSADCRETTIVHSAIERTTALRDQSQAKPDSAAGSNFLPADCRAAQRGGHRLAEPLPGAPHLLRRLEAAGRRD